MLHCKGIDPFITLMGNFNWGPISRNDIVSSDIDIYVILRISLIVFECITRKQFLFRKIRACNPFENFSYQWESLISHLLFILWHSTYLP